MRWVCNMLETAFDNSKEYSVGKFKGDPMPPNERFTVDLLRGIGMVGVYVEERGEPDAQPASAGD